MSTIETCDNPEDIVIDIDNEDDSDNIEEENEKKRYCYNISNISPKQYVYGFCFLYIIFLLSRLL
tara:strand:+ start:389 stop:583 length:195 start_codon:yes stop_codon:yes gene_type:complete